MKNHINLMRNPYLEYSPIVNDDHLAPENVVDDPDKIDVPRSVSPGGETPDGS